MKVMPKTINNFVITPGEKSVILTINESLEVEYLLTKNSDNEILQDLVEAKAYATALLYLNETDRLITNTKLFKENKVEDYYKDCNNLLKENVEIVETKGIPLVSINGYNIYESDIGIIRGNGKKKLKESFELDLFPAIKNQVLKYKKEGKNKYDIEDYIQGQVRQSSISKEEANELKKLLNENNKAGINIEDLARDLVDFGEDFDTYDFRDNYNDKEEAYEETLKSLNSRSQIKDIITFIKNVIEDTPEEDHEREESLIARLEQVLPTLNEDGEGTQVGDIAPKMDQDMNGKTKKKEKKYYDILLSGIDESMDSILNKGFMKNINGQYERDGYVLIKENNKFIAIRKDKLVENYEGQMSIDENGLPELPYPYSIQARNDGKYQITSSHPYDETDYSWAVSTDSDIDGLWKVYEPNPDYSIYMDIDKRPAQYLFIDAIKGWDKTLKYLQRLDSTIKSSVNKLKNKNLE